MRFKLTLIAVCTLLVLTGSKAFSALVWTSIDDTEFQNFTSYPLAWTVLMQGGGTGSIGQNATEIFVVANVGEAAQHAWSFPESITVSYDMAGNLDVSAGSTVVPSVQPTLAFNAIVVRVFDNTDVPGFSGGTSFSGITTSGVSVRDLFAESLNTLPATDQIIVYDSNGLDIDNFLLSGDLSFDPFFGVSANAKLEIYGVNVPAGGGLSVPEPSSFLLLLLGSSLCLVHRKRT